MVNSLNSLGSSMYADADVRHCNKLIELQTTELAGQDLDKYYKALDRAIMKFHGLKLAEINKIIREYWIKTYQGNGIILLFKLMSCKLKNSK